MSKSIDKLFKNAKLSTTKLTEHKRALRKALHHKHATSQASFSWLMLGGSLAACVLFLGFVLGHFSFLPTTIQTATEHTTEVEYTPYKSTTKSIVRVKHMQSQTKQSIAQESDIEKLRDMRTRYKARTSSLRTRS
jgi:hypothetical protein